MVPQRKSLLDQALDNYDTRLTLYYRKLNDLECSAPDVREYRQIEVTEAKRFLDNQRVNAVVLSSIQAKLDAYREAGKELVSGKQQSKRSGLKQLLEERHHPTRLLGKHMHADGKPKPSPQHAAHHIIPGRGKTSHTYLARTHMHINGIRINDPDNGVWLPMHKKHTPHWSMPTARSHLEYHTREYEYKVSRRVVNKLNESLIRKELQLIGVLLQQNHLSA